MKKIWLLTSLFILLLTWCNNNQTETLENVSLLTWDSLIQQDVKDNNEETELINNITNQDITEYKFYTTEKFYDSQIKINEDNLTDLQKELFNKYDSSIKTNDSTWDIELLNIIEKERDKTSYKRWFYDANFDPDGISKYDNPWEDNNNLYLSIFWDNYAVSKQELETPIQFDAIWIQAVEWYLGYSSGYIILFPFKFPVDGWSFILSEQDRRYRVQNWWDQYHHYIWSDANYIYLWDLNWNLNSSLIIKRIPKQSDFKILEKDEEWKWVYGKDSWFEDVTSEFIWNSMFEYEESLVNYPPLYKNWNYLLVSDWIWEEYYNWIWRFPVDMSTLEINEFEYFDSNDNSEHTYSIVSDKDYYYQIIDSKNWYKTFLRIHK